MTIRTIAALGLLASLTAPAPLWAKGDMVLIEIKGATLPAPIKITDPIIQEFNIWAGPGVNGGVLESATGFIIDWTSGIVAQHPAGLEHYEVSFYAGCRPPSHEPGCLAETPRLVYVVSYEYDPLSKRGFVYLLRPGEPGFEVNRIYHGNGIEGHWFAASDSWERFVSPLIAKHGRT